MILPVPSLNNHLFPLKSKFPTFRTNMTLTAGGMFEHLGLIVEVDEDALLHDNPRLGIERIDQDQLVVVDAVFGQHLLRTAAVVPRGDDEYLPRPTVCQKREEDRGRIDYAIQAEAEGGRVLRNLALRRRQPNGSALSRTRDAPYLVGELPTTRTGFQDLVASGHSQQRSL